MQKNICVAQSKEEVKYLIKHISEEVTVLPLDLGSLIYCLNNNINFIKIEKFLPKNFHKESIGYCERYLKRFEKQKFKYSFIKIFLKKVMRYEINSSILLYEIITNISKSFKITKVYVSGWERKINQNDINNYSITRIIKQLDINIPIKEIIRKKNLSKKFNNNYTYEYFLKKKYNSEDRTILISNLGYNFKRIIFWARKNNFKTLVINFNENKLNFFRKIVLRFLNVNLLNVNKKIINKPKNLNIKIPIFKYKKKFFTKIVKNRLFIEKHNLGNILHQMVFIKKFFKNIKINLIISNISNDISAGFAEIGKLSKIPSLNISHGTIAQSFDKFDILYKKVIAEGVFSGTFNYFAIQSKITKKSLNTHQISGKPLETGNLIFSEAITNNKKKSILYSVTNKNFECIQFLGVEMHYEYLKNLELLSNLNKDHGYKITIKLHDTIKDSQNDLKKMFPLLKFSNKKIEDELKNAFVNINFSSTTIEDSLYSNIPVILFDQWKRYRHCESSLDPSNKKLPIYYVNEKKSLLKALKTIEKRPNFNFSRFIYYGQSKYNVANTINNIINQKSKF